MCACRCMYMEGHPPGHPRERSFPSVPPPRSPPPSRFPSLPRPIVNQRRRVYGNANFCAGRVVVLTRRKTSNGELTFSFVPPAFERVRGRRYFPKVAALNFTVDGRRSRERARATSGFGKIQLPRSVIVAMKSKRKKQ